MFIPEPARARFEPLVTRPLRSNRVVRAEVSAYVTALEASGPGPQELEVARAVLTLVTSIDRYTSPLYQRLLQATGAWLVEQPPHAQDWALTRQLVVSVARSTKRFQLDLDAGPS